MYVLDSSILIELFEKRSLTPVIVDFLKEEPPVTTSICAHEVLAGARTDKERFVFENLLHQMHILDHDSHAARVGSSLWRELRQMGISLTPFDTLIAGICKANNAELVTLDHDFAKIKGMKTTVLLKRNT